MIGAAARYDVRLVLRPFESRRLLKLAFVTRHDRRIVICTDCGERIDAANAATLAELRRGHRCRGRRPA
jgi:hypothetical protein